MSVSVSMGSKQVCVCEVLLNCEYDAHIIKIHLQTKSVAVTTVHTMTVLTTNNQKATHSDSELLHIHASRSVYHLWRLSHVQQYEIIAHSQFILCNTRIQSTVSELCIADQQHSIVLHLPGQMINIKTCSTLIS